MVSWTTASRHITGTHMEAHSSLHVIGLTFPSHSHQNTKKIKVKKLLLTLCLDERFCNLSFGCLNSFVFICPGSQKPDPLITAWLLCKGGRRHRSPFTHLKSLRWSSRGKNSCWFACQARHKFLLAGWFDREFPCAIVCRYSPVFHSFMPIQVEGRAAGEKAGFFWRGLRSQERYSHPFPF